MSCIHLAVILKNGGARICKSPAVLARLFARDMIASVSGGNDPEGLADALEHFVGDGIRDFRETYGRRPQCTWEWALVAESALLAREEHAGRAA